MLDARFSHLYFYRSLHTLQCSLAAIADLLVSVSLSFTVLFLKKDVIFKNGRVGFRHSKHGCVARLTGN